MHPPPPSAPASKVAFIGIDLGTSGCRGMAIDAQGEVIGQHRVGLPPPWQEGPRREQEPSLWWQALAEVLGTLGDALGAAVEAVAIDGTSGTLLLADTQGAPLGPALMYNDARATAQADHIARHAPRESGAHGATASLAKLLWLRENTDTREAAHALHQADWLAGRLSGRWGVSDENNALKLGYDPAARQWPQWLGSLDNGHALTQRLLPRVEPPGTPIGTLGPVVAKTLGLPPNIRVVTGTTDSIAAFLATGASHPGEAVTSLGSTLALKIITDRPVFSPADGVYSHRLWDRWLAGGASNSGGAVLRRFFSDEALRTLTPRLNPEEPTGLNYYPLPSPGERFPTADPRLVPRMTPRPEDDARFLQGLLEGMADIEHRGYARLQALGAPYPTAVYSVGGGAQNPAWARIRGQRLAAEMREPVHTEAAYGAALLARRGIMGAKTRGT